MSFLPKKFINLSLNDLFDFVLNDKITTSSSKPKILFDFCPSPRLVF